MNDEKEERWIGICRQIATEQDLERFVELITELNRLLDENRNDERCLGTAPSTVRSVTWPIVQELTMSTVTGTHPLACHYRSKTLSPRDLRPV